MRVVMCVTAGMVINGDNEFTLGGRPRFRLRVCR